MRRPDVFLVGAPKSGTSAMSAHLGRHPEIFVPTRKEPQFFGRDQERWNCRPPALDEYLSLYAEAGGATHLADCSTNYLYSRSAAEEISEFSPDARILITLRNPITVVHALHGEMVAGGFEPIADLAAALDAEDDRRAGRDLPNRRGIRENLYYRQVVDFATHVERYLAVFRVDRVKILLFDDWLADMAGVYEDVLRFLAVDPLFRPAFDVVNPSTRVRSVRAHRLVLEPPSFFSRMARAVLPQRTRARIGYSLLRANRREAPRDPIPSPLLERLRSELMPGIERLGTLLRRDLSPWIRLEGVPAASGDSTPSQLARQSDEAQ